MNKQITNQPRVLLCEATPGYPLSPLGAPEVYSTVEAMIQQIEGWLVFEGSYRALAETGQEILLTSAGPRPQDLITSEYAALEASEKRQWRHRLDEMLAALYAVESPSMSFEDAVARAFRHVNQHR